MEWYKTTLTALFGPLLILFAYAIIPIAWLLSESNLIYASSIVWFYMGRTYLEKTHK